MPSESTMSKFKIIARANALERGLSRYFTGKPCKHGHVTERQVSNRNCAACSNIVHHRYQHSPKGEETVRRYWQSSKGRENKRRMNQSPKGREANWSYRQTPKGEANRQRVGAKRRSSETYHEHRNRQDRERRLDRALDVTQPDHDPARAARLLARWNARAIKT
jgi:hypothetical protein